MKDTGFVCLDCHVDTMKINEYYMVKDTLWLEANPADFGMLCINCLETRLGRQLKPEDFPDYPINQGFFEQSELLKSRINHNALGD